MEGSYLYSLANNTDFDSIPVLWRSVDFVQFSENKILYPYQKEALQNTLKILYRFFNGYPTKPIEKLKKEFSELATYNNLSPLEQKRFFAYTDQGSNAYKILSENDYYEEINDIIPAFNFINRMSFWMATGSGKSIVLIKLMELLHDLMNNELIPKNDILFLTHRQDLIEQLKAHINEFNTYSKKERNIEFIVRDLRELPDRKIANESFKDYFIDIYFYRSDLISDTQKENIINFQNYDNKGNWYVILDEAHKGDNDESKRKQYYNILSRNGFLFNFSATFTEEIDVLSTVYNLNLSEYIKKGFGKHLFVMQEQFNNFQTYEVQEGKKVVLDFIEEEKQKIVLMSLILLTFIKIKSKAIRVNNNYYHNPLLLTLVNSVSAEDSDLYLFFRELQKIAKKDVNDDLFEMAKDALTSEFFNNKLTEFEKDDILSDPEILEIKNITLDDILHNVFNTDTIGEFEVKRNPKNKQQLSFRVKSGAESEPFALIKIGDVKEFEKNNLSQYDIEEEFEESSLFENIDESSVNILMGSRAFYEGWDSNRPNIINFVNIGTQKEAKKFILQSIGRGIRIEPIKNNRKRLLPLINDKISIPYELTQNYGKVKPLETLFIFGTNKNAILSVLEHLRSEQPEEEYNIDLFSKLEHQRDLLIPQYRTTSNSKINDDNRYRLRIHNDDFIVFDDLMQNMDKRAFALNFNLQYEDVKLLKNKHNNVNNFKKVNEEKIGRTAPLVKHILNYYKIAPEEIDTFSVVREEIQHYKSVKVNTSITGNATSIEFRRLGELKNKIEKAKNPVDMESEKLKLKEKYKDDLDRLLKEYDALKEKSSQGEEVFEHRNDKIRIKKLLNHYYFPSIIAETDRIKWMKHIIDTPSEIEFIKALEKYLKKDYNFFSKFDWWLFSKIDHTLDKEIRIPYIDPAIGKRDFLPDFVFWLQKDNDYHILYIDPKGTGRNDYQHKVDGYCSLFTENGNVRKFEFKNMNIYVHLRLATDELNKLAKNDFYKKYWIDINNLEFDIFI